MSEMQLRTDRLGLLADQFASSAEISRARLDGLGDEEYFWAPHVPTERVWSVRRRGGTVGRDAFGPGEWQLDFDHGADVEAGAVTPVTTIAWRIGHVNSMLAGRWEWSFGGRSVQPQDVVDFAGTAAAALTQLRELTAQWQRSIETLTDQQLDTVGFGQYPWGLDPHVPFAGILWWINREYIHHLAEVALLRDLWQASA